ncbi:MAG TPA: hypothetical protein VLD35_15195 [Caldimonas sp.]|nr:hypothetical protein [Caldimonas sp.]
MDDHGGVAIEQATQPREGDLERLLAALAAIAGPQAFRDEVDAHGGMSVSSQHAKQLQRLARGLAAVGQAAGFGRDLEVAERAHAHRPGPRLGGLGWRGEVAGADGRAHPLRFDARLERAHEQPGDVAGQRGPRVRPLELAQDAQGVAEHGLVRCR